MEQRLGILDPEKIMPNYQQMSRKLADAFEEANNADPFLGVRKGRMEWNMITKRSDDPKVPHETEKEQTAVYKEVAEYDKLLHAVEIVQFCTEFAEKQKPGQSQDISGTKDLIALLTLREEDILNQAPRERGGMEHHEASERLSLF